MTYKIALSKARSANYCARRHGAEGTITAEDVIEVFEAQTECVYCGTPDELTLDHKIALANKGANHKNNLQVACLRCNSSKCDNESPNGKPPGPKKERIRARKRIRPVKTARLDLRVTIETRERIEALAEIEDCSMSEVVVRAIRELYKRLANM